MRSIYLDNNATTVLDPEVLEVMVETSKHPWNASSVHRWGREAKCALKEARDTLAKTLGVSSDSLLFTSGGTESMNMLIKGLYPGSGKILTTRIEHACVEEALLATGQDKLVYVQATRGAPTLEAIEEAL
ncbi:MAG: aminotransferase class V-fold PLP-dependent enzyme, partial [Chlamydiae bacterium]|nr:aminotransferase class V-fold PLP-dependent enzyme [Chlamydiota bacterium]